MPDCSLLHIADLIRDPRPELTWLLAVIAAAIAAFLTALFAGYFGAVFGSRRKRAEEAFANRLDWYKRVTAAIRKFDFDINTATEYQREKNPDAGGNWMVVREDGYIPLFMLIGEAEIFATPAGVNVMQEFWRHLEPVSKETDYFGAARMLKPGNIQKVAKLQGWAREASNALVNDIRRQLKFESLERNQDTRRSELGR